MPRGKKTAKAGTQNAASDAAKTVVEEKTTTTTTTDVKAPVEKKAEPAKKDTAVEKKAEPVSAASAEKKAEPEVKKPAARRGRPKGSTSKKTAEKKPVTRKKSAKAEIMQEVYLEFGQHEPVLTEKLVERIKDKWRNDGHRTSSIKSLRVYIKPEDHKAYYVINEKDNGFVEF